MSAESEGTLRDRIIGMDESATAKGNSAEICSSNLVDILGEPMELWKEMTNDAVNG